MSSSSGGGGVLAGAFSALFGLDRVFFDARKLKTNLKILSGRIKLLSEKRHARIESIERDVEKLLKELFEETTKGLGGGRRGRRKEEDAEKTTMERALMSRVESIENERNFLQILKHVDQFATEILETLCERSIEDVELTSSEAMRTSIASMLHAKSANKGRLTNDLPELKAIANELGKKFGKAFAVSCEREKTSEACGVSKRFIAAIAKCEKKKDERDRGERGERRDKRERRERRERGDREEKPAWLLEYYDYYYGYGYDYDYPNGKKYMFPFVPSTANITETEPVCLCVQMPPTPATDIATHHNQINPATANRLLE